MPETASASGDRAGVDPADARVTLDALADKGVVRRKKSDDGEPAFGLKQGKGLAPGIVDAWRRSDSEIATLYEQYYEETRGQNLRHGPAPFRVIPAQQSITARTEIYPYEQAEDITKNAEAWGVRDCVCKVEARLLGASCDHPLEVCMPISPKEGAFDDSTLNRVISKEEALEILRMAEEAGLVHAATNVGGVVTGICNCCPCACPMLRAYAEYELPTAMAHSDFWSIADADRCTGC